MRFAIILLSIIVFNGNVLAGTSYPGLVCADTKKNDVSVSKLQSDNYNGYNYLEFKENDSALFGGFLYYGGSQYHAYVQETMRIAMIAYLFKMKVNVCYAIGTFNNSINAIELAE